MSIAPFKLNLGCGITRIPGYIGVDLYGGEYKADIRALPKEWENMAEEVMAIHVIEHFPYYETQAVLLEWKRVLKPGGRIVLECPDLKEACRNFLMNPLKYNRGLHCIYGEQDYGTIESVHKSGWTVPALIRELEVAGFREVYERPAQHKRRAPRDIRVEGVKL